MIAIFAEWTWKGLRSGPCRFPQSVGPYGTKLYVMTPETLTGWPESSVGLNRAPRAAETAAGLSSGCPLTALAEMTLPVSLDQHLNADGTGGANRSCCWRIWRLRKAGRLTVKHTARDRSLVLPLAVVAAAAEQLAYHRFLLRPYRRESLPVPEVFTGPL